MFDVLDFYAKRGHKVTTEAVTNHGVSAKLKGVPAKRTVEAVRDLCLEQPSVTTDKDGKKAGGTKVTSALAIEDDKGERFKKITVSGLFNPGDVEELVCGPKEEAQEEAA